MRYKVITEQHLDLVLEALRHRVRRRLVYLLSLEPSSISFLASRQGMSLPAMHRHIRMLEKAGLIVRKKVGRSNVVAIHRPTLRLAQDWIMQFRTDLSTQM